MADTATASERKLPTAQLIAGAALLLVAGGVFADYWSAKPPGIEASFVGRASCVDCHQQETELFRGSHHDLAMDIATDESVLGDFDDATIEHHGILSRLYRDGERFMVHTEGPTGEMEDFQVKYVFGVDPLQQYMVEFDRTADMGEDEIARLQVLRISWDTHKQQWFYLEPPDVADKLNPDDPLHWTGIAQRWQTMCADCHSTNLKRNFDPARGRYHTTFSEIDVSCEACHGPASLHIELANSRSLFWDRHYGYGLAKLKGDDPEPQIQTCAPCHSRRGVIDQDFRAGDLFSDHYALETLSDATYHADGQIKDEVYVYGSFIQSRMYHKGIRCTDCHDPHSLKLKAEGNQICTSCHQHAAGKYDVPSHHHHVPGTPGAMCVNCHMPHTTYMAVDPRRDHSLRVPRPDLSVKLGTPNACSSCHVKDRLKSLDATTRASLEQKEYAGWLQLADGGDESIVAAVRETDQWCDDACDKWYGSARKTPPHFAEPLAAFRNGEPGAIEEMLRLASQPDEMQPAIARATALAELAAVGAAQAVPLAVQILKDPSQAAIVKAGAINVFMNAPPGVTEKTLVPLLGDSSRLVRTEAARVLVASGTYQQMQGSRSRVELALREVHDALMAAADRAGAHMAWAMLCEQQGRFEDAVSAYEMAMRVEPNSTGPRTNLASLLERLASQPGPQSQQWRARSAQLRAEELPLLGRDAALAPDIADVQYRYGLALYLSGDHDAALEQLKKAVDLAPDVEMFQTALRLLQEKMRE